MSAPWWETYDDRAPMVFPRRDNGPVARLALMTDPKLELTRGGTLRLKLINRHPHEAVRIFTTKRPWKRP